MHQDVTDEARWPEVVAEAESRFGGLQVLVCNAGIGIMVPSVLDMSLAEWRRQMAINVDGVFLNVKYGIPAIRRAGKGGSVVMISSVAGLRGSAGLAGYSATKGAVRLFAKSVALECAGARDNIRCNSVHPGIIATPIWEKIPAGMGGGRNAPIDPHQLAAARRADRRGERGEGHRRGRAVAGLRRVAPCDGERAGDRWRDDGGADREHRAAVGRRGLLGGQSSSPNRRVSRDARGPQRPDKAPTKS